MQFRDCQDCAIWLADAIETEVSSKLSKSVYRVDRNDEVGRNDWVRHYNSFSTYVTATKGDSSRAKKCTIRLSNHPHPNPHEKMNLEIAIGETKEKYKALKIRVRETSDGIVVDEAHLTKAIDGGAESILRELDIRIGQESVVARNKKMGLRAVVELRCTAPKLKYARYAEQCAKALVNLNLSKDQTVECVVKSISGISFVDLGGINGWLYQNQITWGCVKDPSEIARMMKVGDTIKVKILEIENNGNAPPKVIVGLKQLDNHLWNLAPERYPPGSVQKGRVTHISHEVLEAGDGTDFPYENYQTAFVELEAGVGGWVSVDEMSWTKTARKIVRMNQQVDVMVLEIDCTKHHMALSLKQSHRNPWDLASEKHPPGSVHKGLVTHISHKLLEAGDGTDLPNEKYQFAFVELETGLGGWVYVDEMSWTKTPGYIVYIYSRVDVMVLEIDGIRRHMSLSLKRTKRNPWKVFSETHPIGTEVEGAIKNINKFGLFIGLKGGIDGLIHLSGLSWDEPSEESIQNYRKGDVVQAVVSEVDVEKERISLSIKALGMRKGEGTCS